MVTELLRKYIWLVNTLTRAGERGLSLEELARKWENRFDQKCARRTFNNHREAIFSIFGIRIECNRSTSRYYIAYSDDVRDSDAADAWLINTFTVNSLLSLGKERLSGRVSVEEIPSGQRHLAPLMDAMTDGYEVSVRYRKYSAETDSAYTLRPYAVKEYARRWYLVAYCIEKGQIRVYGLDRIVEMEITGTHFTMPEGFDVDTLFRTSFGVYLTSEPPVEITFRADRKQARYLNDLPIHGSQKVLASDDNSVTFSIFASPDESMLMEFMRLGPKVEILTPEDIRERIAEAAEQTLEKYRRNGKPDQDRDTRRQK